MKHLLLLALCIGIAMAELAVADDDVKPTGTGDDIATMLEKLRRITGNIGAKNGQNISRLHVTSPPQKVNKGNNEEIRERPIDTTEQENQQTTAPPAPTKPVQIIASTAAPIIVQETDESDYPEPTVLQTGTSEGNSVDEETTEEAPQYKEEQEAQTTEDHTEMSEEANIDNAELNVEDQSKEDTEEKTTEINPNVNEDYVQSEEKERAGPRTGMRREQALKATDSNNTSPEQKSDVETENDKRQPTGTEDAAEKLNDQKKEIGKQVEDKAKAQVQSQVRDQSQAAVNDITNQLGNLGNLSDAFNTDKLLEKGKSELLKSGKKIWTNIKKMFSKSCGFFACEDPIFIGIMAGIGLFLLSCILCCYCCCCRRGGGGGQTRIVVRSPYGQQYGYQ